MLPIITAELFSRSPKVAVKMDKTTIRKKSWLGVPPLISLSTACSLSFCVKLLKMTIGIKEIISYFNLCLTKAFYFNYFEAEQLIAQREVKYEWIILNFTM